MEKKKCNDTGEINIKYVEQWINTSWIPIEGKYETVRQNDNCNECKRKGYFELK